MTPEWWASLGLPASAGAWIVLAALPLVLASCTAFTKISIVLAALRQGLSAERILPVGSMLALAIVLTAVVMAPVGSACAAGLEALAAEDGGSASAVEWLGAFEPLWSFLGEHARAEELERFAALNQRGVGDPLVLVPAFLVSELGAGLELAVMVLLPFVVVELVIAEVMVLLGLQQTPTAVFALPAKVLLFLAADGWQLIVTGLVEGYR